MISTEKMLSDIIKQNIEFNEVLDANQKGYEVRYIETNNPESYENYPGFKILENDDLFTKIRIFLRTDPLKPFRLKEKPRDTNPLNYLQISYKNGMGGMVINMKEISDGQLKKIIKAIQNT